MNKLSNTEVPAKCPSCNKPLKFKLNAQSTICLYCKVSIKLQIDRKSKRELRAANKELKKLMNFKF